MNDSSTRPGNVTTKKVVVTDEWWGDFTYRAFNVALAAGGSIVGQEDAVMAALTIYVPNN